MNGDPRALLDPYGLEVRYRLNEVPDVGRCLACNAQFALRPVVAEFWDYDNAYAGVICYQCLLCEDLENQLIERGWACQHEAQRLWLRMRQETLKCCDYTAMPSLWQHMNGRPEELFRQEFEESPFDRAQHAKVMTLLHQADDLWVLAASWFFGQ